MAENINYKSCSLRSVRCLFARIRINGKLIRRSLETKTLSVAKLRLTDLEKSERTNLEVDRSYAEGKMTFGEALTLFRQRVKGNPALKPKTKEHREERLTVIEKTWAGTYSLSSGQTLEPGNSAPPTTR